MPPCLSARSTDTFSPLVPGAVPRFDPVHAQSGHGSTRQYRRLLVDDLEECCTRLEAQEIAVVGKDTSQPQWQQAFISPRSAFGVLYQLAQSRQRRKRAPE